MLRRQPQAGPAAAAALPPNGLAAVGRTQAASGCEQPAAPLAHLVLSAQSIIYTANMTVRVSAAESAAAARRVTGIVVAAGGYISDEQEIIPPGKTGDRRST